MFVVSVSYSLTTEEFGKPYRDRLAARITATYNGLTFVTFAGVGLRNP
jgi:hypothetical protein